MSLAAMATTDLKGISRGALCVTAESETVDPKMKQREPGRKRTSLDRRQNLGCDRPGVDRRWFTRHSVAQNALAALGGNHAQQRRIAVTCGWIACIAVGSFLSENWKSVLLTKGQLHLPIHFAVFALSGFFVQGISPSSRKRTMFYAALIGFALSLELLQFAIYTIHFEWRDFTADTAGILTALAVDLIRFSHKAHRLSPSKPAMRL